MKMIIKAGLFITLLISTLAISKEITASQNLALVRTQLTIKVSHRM